MKANPPQKTQYKYNTSTLQRTKNLTKSAKDYLFSVICGSALLICGN